MNPPGSGGRRPVRRVETESARVADIFQAKILSQIHDELCVKNDVSLNAGLLGSDPHPLV
jgi:hypothetical protein